MSKTVQIAARVPREVKDRLDELARRNDRSPSAEIRLALKAHLDAAEAEREAAA